ncbi:glycosyltransferase family 9 protein [Rhodopila sp.]|uniref:glycosyltransferase family 9 protein n=1 Tax=Rhodopila sp. TaxID=2480087 RepID=UPI002BA10C2F|nr:glycosyltransferase family 9 protein [Rhodopila sp.]HVZ09431.1 glycosyltransferase family 9 protein [Rhodopila sp.]
MATTGGQDHAAHPASAARPNILVVKLGAFGNVVLSLAAFAAIRRHHPHARITVLTTPPYADWLRTFPYFDDVLVDRRPAWLDFPGLALLRRRLTERHFTRVYDLQTSTRSSRYFHLFPPKRRPDWSGIAFGCSLPDRNPKRNRLHDVDRQQEQLRQAGLTVFPPADLSWCRGDIGRFDLPRDIALLVPGSSPNRLAKRWPIDRFAALAAAIAGRGVTPVVLGTAQEQALAAEIPNAIDLTGQTSFGDLCDLARAARFAVGNDTGPMHLIATAGCPAITLFSADSDPALCAPRGPWTRVLRRPVLTDLPIEEVLATLPEHVSA